MPEKITEKAILICNKGAKPSELKVTSQDFFYGRKQVNCYGKRQGI
jgi:hypothetical protein